MKLRDVLPKEFFPKHMFRCTGYFGIRTTPASRLLDVDVKAEHSRTSQNDSFKQWPDTHKNVSVWWELENGKAVGWNEGRRGWSFPVRTLNRKAVGRPRIWNVPAEDGCLYVCAANGRKAANLIHRADYDITFRKVAKYSTDDWGNAMRGIAREPGVWIVRNDGDKPERLI